MIDFAAITVATQQITTTQPSNTGIQIFSRSVEGWATTLAAVLATIFTGMSLKRQRTIHHQVKPRNGKTLATTVEDTGDTVRFLAKAFVEHASDGHGGEVTAAMKKVTEQADRTEVTARAAAPETRRETRTRKRSTTH